VSNYSPILSYGPKDTLPHGDPNKVLRGAQLDAELQAIATAISSKAESASVSATLAAGSYTSIFQSGSVQVCGPGNAFNGFGDFQFGRLLPNASGTPCVGVLLGGAGQTQVVYITDEQIPGQKGINVIREAGDASAVAPANNEGGDLLDFAGASFNGPGGTAKYQGGSSVNGDGGPAILHGGNSTNGPAGPAYVQGGETGQAGANVELIATKLNGIAGVIRNRVNSVFLNEWHENGQLFLYTDSSGYGLAGQPLVSGGPSGSIKYQTGFTGSKVIGGQTYTWASGILISVV
jgi:hypothetical protein